MTDGPGEAAGGSLIRPFLHERPAAAPATRGLPGRPAPPSTGGTAVRPFLVTSGRTASATAMPVETQVVATDAGGTAMDALTFEYRDIMTLCAAPLAVAEIAAQLRLHLGVIRVLITDLQQQGLVTTYSPEIAPADDVEMILRVIHGLRQRV